MSWIKNLRRRLDAMGLRQARRIVVFVIGMTVLILGVALLVLPGPAILVIPAGLAILGLEFRWARRLLRQAKALWQRPTKPPTHPVSTPVKPIPASPSASRPSQGTRRKRRPRAAV